MAVLIQSIQTIIMIFHVQSDSLDSSRISALAIKHNNHVTVEAGKLAVHTILLICIYQQTMTVLLINPTKSFSLLPAS